MPGPFIVHGISTLSLRGARKRFNRPPGPPPTGRGPVPPRGIMVRVPLTRGKRRRHGGQR